MVVILFSMFTSSNARSGNCPTPQWFVAEFIGIADKVISPPVSILDSDLTFFRDVMLFTKEEIVQVEEDAIQFFNTRFGLDFSQSEPDEWGQRFYQNATFFPARVSPEVQYTVTFNHWIVSGNTRSVCFGTSIGSFRVEFSAQQILHGTYAGEEGIPVAPTDALAYGYYNIPVCPQEPLVIQFSSGTPLHVYKHDGFVILNLDLFHHVCGRGRTRGNSLLTPTEDSRVHYALREIFTFPAHPV